MKSIKTHARAILVVALISFAIGSGCGSKPTQPLAGFQPEIVNNPDNFAFQATAVKNVTATLQYTWSNSGTRATVNHSSVVNLGSAVVQIYDANNIEVYSNALLPSGTLSTAVGVTGNWTIKVTLTKVYGTLNFRVQML
jgi:hypothetical protein